MSGQLKKLHLIPAEEHDPRSIPPDGENDRVVVVAAPTSATPGNSPDHPVLVDPSAPDYAKYDQDSFWPLDNAWINAVTQFAQRRASEEPLTAEDIVVYRRHTEQLSRDCFGDCDLIFAHGRTAIPALLAATRPFVAVETGAGLASGVSVNDRMLDFARSEASALIASQLSTFAKMSRRYTSPVHYVPPVLDGSIWRTGSRSSRKAMRRRVAGRFSRPPRLLVWSPLPQDWEVAGNDRLLRSLHRWLAAVPAHQAGRVRCLLRESGPDLQRSRKLIGELELLSHVSWIDPDSPRTLAEVYRGADLVVDRMMPRPAPEDVLLRALATGVDVVGSYDDEWLANFGDERPPIAGTDGEDDLHDLLSLLLDGRGNRDGPASPEAASWHAGHFSAAATKARLDAIARSILDPPESPETTGFHSLRQKRWELRYEAASVDDYDAKYHRGVAYQVMDQKLTDIIRDHLSVDSPRILDLGCGPGSLMPCLAQIPGARLIGVDLSPEMIEAARHRHPDVEFHVGDAEALRFDDDSFDAVLCSGVLHHLPSRSPTLREIRRVLVPDGIFVAREPNSDNFSLRNAEFAFAHLCLKHFLQFARDEVPVSEPEAHDYHRDFEFGELVEEIRRHMLVESVQTDMRVSYFYEVIDAVNEYAPVDRMEESLAEIPGLNIVVVARNGGSGPGVEPAARAAMDAMSVSRPVPPEHIEALLDFTDSMATRYLPRIYFERTAFRPAGWTRLLDAIRRARRVLIASDLVNFVAETSASLQEIADIRSLDEASESVSRRTIFKTVGTAAVQPTHHGLMDVCLVQMNGMMSYEDLHILVRCCRDYGLIHLEGRASPAQPPKQGERSWLHRTALLNASRDDASGAFSAILAPLAYSPLDVYKAVLVGLDKEYPPERDRDDVRAIRQRVRESISELESTGVYSRLRAMESGETLGALLDGSWKAGTPHPQPQPDASQ